MYGIQIIPIALFGAAISVVPVLVLTIIGALNRIRVFLAALGMFVLLSFAYWCFGLWGGIPIVGVSWLSFHHTFWLWWISWLVTAVVLGVAGTDLDNGDGAFRTGTPVGVVLVLTALYAFIVGPGVWTSGDAQVLADQVTVTMEKPQDYPDTDSNHIVQVPIQVARHNASTAMSQPNEQMNGNNLSTVYQLQTPVLESVQKHLYWIVPLKPNNWQAFSSVKGEVPGYFSVDAEDPNASAVFHDKTSDGQKITMHYAIDGDYEGYLQRYVWLNGYADASVDDWTIEVDDNWRPYFTASLNRMSLNFKMTVPDGALVVDAQTGEIKRYTLTDTPNWVDRVYSSANAKQAMDWWGDFKLSEFAWWRSNANRYKVSGSPVLVYTKEEHPFWQIQMTSLNSDNAVSYMVLFDAKNGGARVYQIQNVATEGAVLDAIGRNNYAVQGKLAGTHLSMHKIEGQLTWVASMVPVDQVSEDVSATAQGIALLPADRPMNAGDLVIGKTMSAALNDYQNVLAGSATVKPNEESQDVVVTVTVGDRLNGPFVESGKSTFYFNVVGDDKHLYKVSVDTMAQNANVEIPMIKTGIKVTISYMETGSKIRQVKSYDDLTTSIGNG